MKYHNFYPVALFKAQLENMGNIDHVIVKIRQQDKDAQWK
jgi:hypothetical protein